MVYTLDFISLLSLVIEYDSVYMTSLALLWSAHSDLAAIMALALMSTVSLDQFSLIRGKLHPNETEAEDGRDLIHQPLVQLLKYQFFGGTGEERFFLIGAEKIDPVRFFMYNLCSTVIWLSVIFLAGITLRIAVTRYIGRFGPVEFEVIMAILAVYITGLMGTVALKRIKPGRNF